MTIESIFCTACAAQMSKAAVACPKCGHPNHLSNPVLAKSKVTAGLLALLLGGLGAHKFYLGKIGAGVAYLLFCWTFVPAVVALVEGIIYLVQDDTAFARAQGIKAA